MTTGITLKIQGMCPARPGLYACPWTDVDNAPEFTAKHQVAMIVCEISVGGIVLGYMYGCPDKDCGEAEDCETPEGYPKPGERSRYDPTPDPSPNSKNEFGEGSE